MNLQESSNPSFNYYVCCSLEIGRFVMVEICSRRSKAKFVAEVNKNFTMENNVSILKILNWIQFLYTCYILISFTINSTIWQILDMDGDEVQLSFMKSESNGTYRWPPVEDISWENKSSIKNVLPKPQLTKSSTNDRQSFTFN